MAAVPLINYFFLKKKGNADKALEYFHEIVDKTSGRYPQAITNVGICMHVQKDYETAKKMYVEALGVNPADQTAKQFFRLASKKGMKVCLRACACACVCACARVCACACVCACL